MRSLVFILALVITTQSINAQQIKGLAKDQDGKAMSGATISLLADTGKAVIKLAVSKADGAYNFSDVKHGNYRVSASYVGYQPVVSAPFSLAADEVVAPDLQLSKTTGDMKAVVVTATKPMVEVKADKTILNVEGTINSVGNDALELLRKAPGVLVDKDDNLSLSGKSGVQVYIDGRPTPLSGQDLANYLKSIQSSNIESIELITNPSAKYEAAGNAGIINIRLKKNKSLGANGSVNAGWNIGTYAKYNGGFNLNYRNQKMNIFGNYNYNHGTNLNNMQLFRTVGDTSFDQRGQMKQYNNGHNYKAGVDFFLNKQSIFGIMANGTLADPLIHNKSRTEFIYNPTQTVARVLEAENTSDMKRNNLNLNLNYSYNTASGKSLTVNADHGSYDINNDQRQPNAYYDPILFTYLYSVNYHMVSPSDIAINSLKVDWEQNFQKGRLGVGGKLGFIRTDNDFKRYDVDGNVETLDKENSNRFTYDENINAAYVNYNRQFKGFMIQFGLRAENTTTEGTSTGEQNSGGSWVKYDSVFKRDYLDFFPSAAITFNKNPMNQFSITYSRRIDRPAYQDLNPFEFKLDEYTYMKGNVNLRPQYTNSFGLTHSFKYKLTTTLNFSHVKDMFVMLPDTVDTNKAFMSKRNLASQDIIALNVSYPFMYKSYMLFTNISTNYSKYKADYGPGRTVDQGAFAFNLYAQNSLKFAKTWTAELSGFYNAPTIWMGAFRAKAFGSIDAGVQKQVMKGKGTIKASVTDIFRTLKFSGTTDFAGQSGFGKFNWESRQFKLNFVYRFGSAQIKAARQRAGGAEDEKKRTEGGGGGIGIGQ